MSKIRTANTKPEVAFRKLLWHAGLRYRHNYRKAPGRPDIALVGWHSLRIWEHEVKKEFGVTFYRVLRFIEEKHGWNWDI